jgi:hypothetical protein
MEDRTFGQFDLSFTQHVVQSMIFSTNIATLTPCYFHHQTHHHHKLMILIRPPEKILTRNFEVFSFKAWYHIALDLLYNVSLALYFSNQILLLLQWIMINNPTYYYFWTLIFSFMTRFEHIPTRLNICSYRNSYA